MPAERIRRCSRCGSNGPFYESCQTSYCKPCWNAYERQRRKAKLVTETPDEREERLAQRRLKRHGRKERIHHRRTPEEAKALILERKRRYYLEHREERIAYVTARRNADVDAAKAYEREVYKRRRAKHQATNRARERKMGSLDAESLTYEAILRCDPCSYCGDQMEHIDHIDPVASDGANHWTNLTAACQPCNRSKWDGRLLAFCLRGLRRLHA